MTREAKRRGFSVRVFLPDGDPDGIKGMRSRTGQGSASSFHAPSSSLQRSEPKWTSPSPSSGELLNVSFISPLRLYPNPNARMAARVGES